MLHMQSKLHAFLSVKLYNSSRARHALPHNHVFIIWIRFVIILEHLKVSKNCMNMHINLF